MSANGANTAGDVEAVRQLIKEAFPPVNARKDLRPLSHDEALQMRSRLASLRNEDLPFYLRQVLEDLIDTHTGKAGESQDAEAVIQHLNVFVEGTDLDTIRSQFGSKTLQQTLVEENYLRTRLAEAYASFNPLQALAISKWLELARGWEDLKWYQEEIEAALVYWRNRAASSIDTQ
jgi:hypothetical protein